MSELGELIAVVEASVRRHGETRELTLGHLLNILKMSERASCRRAEADEAALWDSLDDDRAYGSGQ